MFAYELIIRRKDEGKETAEEEEEKTSFYPFYGFSWFLCGNLVCEYGKFVFVFVFGFLFTGLGFSFFALNQKPALSALWNVIRFLLARYLWDILREFRFGHLRMSSG